MDNRLIIFSALVLAAVLAKLISRRAYIVCKALPILFIIALAFLKPAQVNSLWLAAIVFGLAGDLFLLAEKGFIPGLLTFLLGHVFYIFAFSRAGGGFYYTLPLILGVGFVAALAFAFLTQHLLKSRRKKYILPILLYILVTAFLVIGAFRYPLLSFAVGGAISFAFSDFLLAFNRFVRPSWYVQAGVSLTYYAAQWMLALHFGAV